MEEKAPLWLEETCFELYPSSFNGSHADIPLSKVFSWFMSPLLLSPVSPVFILGSSDPKWSKEPFFKMAKKCVFVPPFHAAWGKIRQDSHTTFPFGKIRAVSSFIHSPDQCDYPGGIADTNAKTQWSVLLGSAELVQGRKLWRFLALRIC